MTICPKREVWGLWAHMIPSKEAVKLRGGKGGAAETEGAEETGEI